MTDKITPEQAWDLVCKYNNDLFHRQHARTVGCVMRVFAEKYDPDNVAHWESVGILHDIDFEQYPEMHCVKGVEILEREGVDESITRSAMSHGWGETDSAYEPENLMEKILFATDELTGLIGACALVRPSRSVQDMELKSLKKKFKQPSFAAGCSRDVITKGAEMLDWDLDRLFTETLDAMKATEDEVSETM